MLRQRAARRRGARRARQVAVLVRRARRRRASPARSARPRPERSLQLSTRSASCLQRSRIQEQANAIFDRLEQLYARKGLRALWPGGSGRGGGPRRRGADAAGAGVSRAASTIRRRWNAIRASRSCGRTRASSSWCTPARRPRKARVHDLALGSARPPRRCLRSRQTHSDADLARGTCARSCARGAARRSRRHARGDGLSARP